ncbi:MAG: hypothetical protein HY706_03615 [Candidatus Hydrogenedentes bacterium]|nr:hypothetical protein [Candidatus Hydrogenedentota bacterium]
MLRDRLETVLTPTALEHSKLVPTQDFVAGLGAVRITNDVIGHVFVKSADAS